MKFFLVEEHDPDYWGGAGSGILHRKYVRAPSAKEAEIYCISKYGRGYWKAKEIIFENTDYPRRARTRGVVQDDTAFGVRERRR